MKYQPQKLVNAQGKMWHIGLGEHDIAKHVILPGDPDRCKLIAAQFDEQRLAGVSRGNPAYTGTKDGVGVSVMSTGMGCMAMAICVEELKEIGAKTLIRLGTGGCLQRDIPPGSFIIGTAAVRGDGCTKEYIDESYPAVADLDVVLALRESCREFGVIPYTGILRSHDAFYMESPGAHEGLEERVQKWTDAHVLALENESSALFVVSSLLGGLRAGTILLTGQNIYDSYGKMTTSSTPDYPEKVDLLSKITLRAIEKIDRLPDLNASCNI